MPDFSTNKAQAMKTKDFTFIQLTGSMNFLQL